MCRKNPLYDYYFFEKGHFPFLNTYIGNLGVKVRWRLMIKKKQFPDSINKYHSDQKKKLRNHKPISFKRRTTSKIPQNLGFDPAGYLMSFMCNSKWLLPLTILGFVLDEMYASNVVPYFWNKHASKKKWIFDQLIYDVC